MVAITAATLGVIYGYDQSNIGGAQLYFEQDLGMTTAAVETRRGGHRHRRDHRGPHRRLGGQPIGRRRRCCWWPAATSCSACPAPLSVSAQMLWVSRLLLGLTIGISLVAVPVFVAESVPARDPRCHSGRCTR